MPQATTLRMETRDSGNSSTGRATWPGTSGRSTARQAEGMDRDRTARVATVSRSTPTTRATGADSMMGCETGRPMFSEASGVIRRRARTTRMLQATTLRMETRDSGNSSTGRATWPDTSGRSTARQAEGMDRDRTARVATVSRSTPTTRATGADSMMGCETGRPMFSEASGVIRRRARTTRMLQATTLRMETRDSGNSSTGRATWPDTSGRSTARQAEGMDRDRTARVATVSRSTPTTRATGADSMMGCETGRPMFSEASGVIRRRARTTRMLQATTLRMETRDSGNSSTGRATWPDTSGRSTARQAEGMDRDRTARVATVSRSTPTTRATGADSMMGCETGRPMFSEASGVIRRRARTTRMLQATTLRMETRDSGNSSTGRATWPDTSGRSTARQAEGMDRDRTARVATVSRSTPTTRATGADSMMGCETGRPMFSEASGVIRRRARTTRMLQATTLRMETRDSGNSSTGRATWPDTSGRSTARQAEGMDRDRTARVATVSRSTPTTRATGADSMMGCETGRPMFSEASGVIRRRARTTRMLQATTLRMETRDSGNSSTGRASWPDTSGRSTARQAEGMDRDRTARVATVSRSTPTTRATGADSMMGCETGRPMFSEASGVIRRRARTTRMPQATTLRMETRDSGNSSTGRATWPDTSGRSTAIVGLSMRTTLEKRPFLFAINLPETGLSATTI